ncbi:MAG TPA: hypothetical protein VLB79_12075 [Solirubrobacterales bacterium]|nr:hypothetical protein [Solirubrobacterales bacterium]
MGRGTRFSVSLATASFALLLSAGSASATFHLIKVREVFPGSAAHPDSSYVELQSYSPFQNQLQFGQLKVYSANGTNVSTFMPTTPPAPVANNANQATAVVADSGFAAAFPGITPDFTDSSLDLNPAGGAVCWPITELPIDCVSWGAFTGNSSLPSSAGSPFQGTGTAGAIGDGKSILRSISASCPSALDDVDDTNNSAGDFNEVAPNPRPNSAPITEMTCPPPAGGPVGTPTTTHKKKKCKKRKKSSAGSGAPSTGGGGPAYSAKKKKCKKRK